MSGKKIVIAVVVVVIIGAFIIINLKKGKGGEIPVQVEEVQRGDITQIVSASGKIQPEVEVKISANISAEIINMFVKEGDIVRRGQLLVVLDSTKYKVAVDRAKSTKKSREASLQKAESEYKRTSDLNKQNLTSQAELENAEANLKLAESQLDQAKADVNQAIDDLSKTRLYSPLAGTVTLVNKEVGEIALGSMFQADVIMVVSDLSRMEVISEVDENDVVLVSIGDSVNIEVDAIPDTVFLGIVSEIAHTATTRGRGTQEEVTNFEVKIAILDKEVNLRPGMSSTVDIKTETRRAVLSVPIQAVTVRTERELNASEEKDDSKKSKTKSKEADDEQEASSVASKDELIEVVFIVKDGIATSVPVKTGISSEKDIEVLGSLEVKQKVVTGSYRALSKTLKNGSRVKITQKPIAKQE
ncbi:efflux RND transporter periplasmic adaptor subunit [candidate division KSB1 bacterium]|nr:efflux RND transporter periplasmic adaptor subunit [candidate division KSB1 bacterium]